MRWNPMNAAGRRTVRTASADGGERIVPSAVPGDPTETVVSPDRMLPLTDGVVAIALTLLVLNLTSLDTHTSSAGTLWRGLVDERGRFIAYIIAFWVIGQFWLAHHRIFRRVTHHDDVLSVRNLWFVFGISLVPFTTMVIGQTKNNPLAVTLFSANLVAISVSLGWLAHTAEAAGVAGPIADDSEARAAPVRRITTTLLFALPGVLAWVIRPDTAELLFLLLFAADVPGGLLERRRERRQHAATKPAGPAQ